MKILEIVPTYPGGLYDGSAIYQRKLNGALRGQGADVSVVSTRTEQPRQELPFFIRWPDELPRRGTSDSVAIRRFRSVELESAGPLLSGAVVRRWSREDTSEGAVLPGSLRYVSTAVKRALGRPPRYDLYADLGRGPRSPTLLAHVARVASRYDVILAGYAPFSLARQVLLATRWSKTPVVLLPFIHEDDRHHHFASLYDTYRQAAAVLTLSDHTAQLVRSWFPESRPVAIGAGVTIDTTRPMAADIEAFRVRHGLEGFRLLLFVGRKEPGKRYDLAIEALDHLPKDVALVMIGRDVDGQRTPSRRVRYLGTVSDQELSAAYEACEVFVFPSEQESFGMVFLDAWKHRKPVIGNAGCGAAAALINDGEDGYLRRDAEGIAEAVRLLLSNPQLAARLGEAGRIKTFHDYTWKRVAERAMEVLATVSRPA